MNPIKKAKDELRVEYSRLRREIAPDEKLRRDKAVCACALAMASFRYADVVLLYAALADEINVNEIALTALSQGKKVAFPRCHKEDHTITYHFVSSLDELTADNYGILEPSPDEPVYDHESEAGSALCFVPGLVYDKAGYRLGYGKGFYDRYLSTFTGCKIGVVYSDFILPTVPRGRYDTSVDILLTEKGVKLKSET